MCTNPTSVLERVFRRGEKKKGASIPQSGRVFFPPLEVPSARDCVPISVPCTRRGPYTQACAAADRGINHTRLVELKTF